MTMSTSRPRQGPGVDSVALSRLEPFVQVQVVDDLGRPQEPRHGALLGLRVLREHPGDVLKSVRNAPSAGSSGITTSR